MINRNKLFLTLTLLFLTLGCSNANLLEQFAAAQSSQIGAIEIMALHHLRDGSEGDITPEGTKDFINDLGYEIELKEAVLHFHRIDLISDGADLECIGGNDQSIDLHSDHDLLGGDLLTHHLATAVIPMAFFCEFELMVGAADHGAVKFDHAGDGDSGHGASEAFHLAGSWSLGGDSGDFSLTGHDPLRVHKIFKTKEDSEVVEHPIHFHEGETVISVLIGTKYDMAFDGVDFKVQSEMDQIDTIYENLEEAIHQHNGDHHGSGGGQDGGGHDHP